MTALENTKMRKNEPRYTIEASGDYFHVRHECAETCDVEFTRYDGSVPWVKITCPDHGSHELKLWKADISSKFIKKMHQLNPQ